MLIYLKKINKFQYLTLLITFLWFTTAIAASLGGASNPAETDPTTAVRLMNWAEQKYPQLFAPAKPELLTIKDEWVYRLYKDTNTAIGVKNNKTVFVTGEPFATFGTLINFGLLSELLITGIDSIPPNPPKNNCVASRFPIAKYRYQYQVTITEKGNSAANDTGLLTRDILISQFPVLKTKETLVFDKNTLNNSIKIISKIIQFSATSTNLKQLIIDTQSLKTGNFRTTIDYEPAQLIFALQLCKDMEYPHPISTATTRLSDFGVSANSGGIISVINTTEDQSLIVEITKELKVPAGIFKTIQSQQNNITTWRDTTGGFIVKQQLIDHQRTSLFELIKIVPL